MRVIVNQFSAIGVRTGIGNYTAELTRCLREQAPDEIDLFPAGCRLAFWEACARAESLLAYGDGRASGTPAARSGSLRGLRLGLRALKVRQFKAAVASRKYDLYHEPSFIPLPAECPTVATIHDISLILHPEWHGAESVLDFEQRLRAGMERCAHFLADSEFTRLEVIRVLGVPPERITTVPIGIRPGLAPLPPEAVARALRRLGLPRDYLLYVGTIEPRKNIRMLLKAYCSLPAALRARCPLVLAGSWGWRTGDVMKYYDESARHLNVIHLGYVPERHLGALYNGARVLVYPSFYEGFGLPPLEMMACGGAVLASTAGALRETVGGRAHMIDPRDEAGWRTAMARVIEDRDWLSALRTGVLETARPYTWERCAEQTLRVYRSLAGVQAAENGR